jgi:hypothetical protein
VKKYESKDLAGQLSESLWEILQGLRKPLAELPEAEQVAYREAVVNLATEAVEACIDTVVGAGVVSIDCDLGKVGVGQDTISASISVDRNNPNRGLLLEGAHKPAKIAFSSKHDELVRIGSHMPAITPDQPSLLADAPVDRPEEPKKAKPRGRPPKKNAAKDPGVDRSKSKPSPQTRVEPAEADAEEMDLVE